MKKHSPTAERRHPEFGVEWRHPEPFDFAQDRLCRRVPKRHSIPFLITLLTLLCFGACSQPESNSETSLTVAVSIDPLAYLVRRIAPEDCTVEVLLPSGQSPATYDLSPQQMARLSDAHAFFTVGVPFEQQLLDYYESIRGSAMIVDTREGIELRHMEDHGHDHGDSEGGADPHVWLDPRLAKRQAEIICSTLCILDTARCMEFSANLSALQQSLDSVHEKVQEQLEPVQGRRMYVYHPAYGYFTDAYGLEQVAVEVSGKEPSARQLSRLLDDAKSDAITTLFVQPQFSSSQVQTMADHLGAQVVQIDPIAPDYIENLMDIAQKVAESYGLEIVASDTTD
jgi:zinc transport system substrate-binding protein